ncbi:hypothetical protein HYPSUDRAFT_40742, partial [Hypholoma sublateritium FD-334 SS-4]
MSPRLRCPRNSTKFIDSGRVPTVRQPIAPNAATRFQQNPIPFYNTFATRKPYANILCSNPCSTLSDL